MADKDKQEYLVSLDTRAMEAELADAFADSETDIDDELIREKRLKNDDIEQDIKLKRTTLRILFGFLLGETAMVFLYAYLQATRTFNFALEEWSFKLLITATIAQIAGMLFVAIRYLFPHKGEK